MKARSRSIIILSILFGYILLQFLWWEILLVRQTGQIITERQHVAALASTDFAKLNEQIDFLQKKKQKQIFMIVGEGTVFLLLLLFGIYKIKQSMDKETALGNQQKNFFLSITHELKTPIAATKLQLQTLQRQGLEESTRQQLIVSALAENERLNALIDNVLFASRLEGSGSGFAFSMKETDLGALCAQVVNRYYAQQIKSGELKMELEAGLKAMVDEQAFQSVLTNLVDNAIKYSASPAEITVSLQRIKDRLLVRVSDKGQGITESEKVKVFEKFYRSGNEETRRSKGTGLGLYIVSYIVRMHQGQIKITDNTPKGSIFEIQLNAV